MDKLLLTNTIWIAALIIWQLVIYWRNEKQDKKISNLDFNTKHLMKHFNDARHELCRYAIGTELKNNGYKKVGENVYEKKDKLMRVKIGAFDESFEVIDGNTAKVSWYWGYEYSIRALKGEGFII